MDRLLWGRNLEEKKLVGKSWLSAIGGQTYGTMLGPAERSN